MSLSTLPLSYCTNVHPGRTVDEVVHGLERYTAPVQAVYGEPIAAGLWLAAAVVHELRESPAAVDKLQRALADSRLVCYTLNAFPYGDFHSERVKEQVYLPDWTADARREYTQQCAEILARLLPEGTEGSLSTVPLGFKDLAREPDFVGRCIAQLLALARSLDELHDDAGRVIRLAIEPEPFCLLETTAETVHFFERLQAAAEAAGLGDVARRHLGVCYDVCHQSVEFEDVAGSIAQLAAADVRINKVHLTCAVRLERPAENAEGRQALARYVEPRYLHQTLARRRNGEILRCVDLSAELCASPPVEFLKAEEWRTHFHVPVNAESIGPLRTTRDDLRRAVEAVARLPYAPHLEVETYTWGVLPGEEKPSLVDGLSAELAATRTLLRQTP
jgi:sugar phosphate isomerase/epimerase